MFSGGLTPQQPPSRWPTALHVFNMLRGACFDMLFMAKLILNNIHAAAHQPHKWLGMMVFNWSLLPQIFAMEAGGAGGASRPPIFTGMRDDYPG